MARKHHFFKTGENISICGRWLYLAHNREPDTFESLMTVPNAAEE